MRIASILALAVLRAPGSAQEEGEEKPGAARTVTVRDGETVTLMLRVAEPTKNLLTVVTLPEAVVHVLSAWDEKDLSVEQEGNRLFLKLLSKVEGHLDVVTSGGAHIRFLILPAEGTVPYDSNVLVKAAPARPVQGPPRAPGASGALELVKAMRLGDVPPDATVRSGGGEVLFSSPDVDVALAWIYETGRFRGTVLALTNKSSSEAYHVDVSRFQGERLVLIGSKDVIVGPQKMTRLYIVEWK